MTDEERQKLCAWLRDASVGWSGSSKIVQAADEIERLATLAQSDAEPRMRETPSEHSLGLAAQAWCEPETSNKIMDEELCTAFARLLDRVKAQSDAEPAYYIPIGGAGNGA